MGFLSDNELRGLGFASLGNNVRISEKASIYRPDLIHLGDHIRIDDFTVISPSEKPFYLEGYNHVGSHSSLIGRESIRLEKFAGISGRVSIYSSTDDYSGEFMTNPTVPEDLTRVESAPVVLMKHVIVGASAVILPGVTVGEVSAIAALSLVSRDIPRHVIAGGTPCRVIKPRSQKVIELEKKINA